MSDVEVSPPSQPGGRAHPAKVPVKQGHPRFNLLLLVLILLGFLIFALVQAERLAF